MNVVKKIPGAIGAIGRHLPILLPRVTFARMINLGVMSVEMILKRPTVASRPAVAKIEASSACNLRCQGCRSGQPLVEYKSGNLSIPNFEIMLEKMGKYLFEIVFYNWGEPLINKKLPALINLAHKNNISVVISTNLHFLTEKMATELINCELDKMIFCLDGWSQESYGEIRLGGNFEQARANIKRFIELRRQAGARRPYLEWQYVVTSKNKSELTPAKRAAREWGVDRFVELVDWCQRLDEKDYFEGLDKAKKKMYSRINRCFWLWSSIVLQYDGMVFPCCHVANKPHNDRIFGNILEEDLLAIWNGEKYRRSRLMMNSKRRITDGDFICKHCYSPPIYIETIK